MALREFPNQITKRNKNPKASREDRIADLSAVFRSGLVRRRS